MKKEVEAIIRGLGIYSIPPENTEALKITPKKTEGYPDSKLTIVGGGIIGWLEACLSFWEAALEQERVRVTLFEKNHSLQDTTTVNIGPSFTPDELASVIARGKKLKAALEKLFNQPNGVRVDDVSGVNDSKVASDFIAAVLKDAEDDLGYEERTRAIYQSGKRSMDLLSLLYEYADPEFKAILIASNFNPCRNPHNIDERTLHDGYRIDLIYGIENAMHKAQAMKQDYQALEYDQCEVLSPEGVMDIDPHLTAFCYEHSIRDEEGNFIRDEKGNSQWKNDAAAIWRPGGCIDAHVFIPLVHQYLVNKMGYYTNDAGVVKPCFRYKTGRKVTGVTYDEANNAIDGLVFEGSSEVKRNKHTYAQSDYLFCPGEAVGTLRALGFEEPEYARFAGASLRLTIALPEDKIAEYATLNHCMEVHQEGVVLAWQVRFIDNAVSIVVAGTKSFYGDVEPKPDEAFAKDRNLLQLNMINDVLPDLISIVLNKPTKGQRLTQADMTYLEELAVARRWVGSRAVAYDGFPTVGPVYNDKGAVSNASCVTHLGSGGVSFALSMLEANRKILFFSSNIMPGSDGQKLAELADSRRTLIR